MIYVAGTTIDELPWSWGLRTLSKTRGDRPRHPYESIPILDSRRFLQGRPQLKITLGALQLLL